MSLSAAIPHMCSRNGSCYIVPTSQTTSIEWVVLRNLADALNVSADYLLDKERFSSQIQNISVLLNGNPESFITSMERPIRLYINEVSNNLN